ncbi:uncharacterized protein BDZ83DRAFT_617713 [Colletotrichum acutatum]|uniref:N-acetyltransferase domain-containing protein n=1 Tax=Glomerella acutata TaxID=27357 RepID=A0AAD8UMD4_GLOAC|nr:uncharacterized protein BDZ83DRAFT_617713 [Colletotrichum acutatum]KAK1726033.1 hypothetical protein BDZ83DRAFT_617713 [Colletotrichum acutatum]
MIKEGGFSFAVMQRNHPTDEQTSEPDNDTDENEASAEARVIGFIGITSPPQIFYIFQRASWGLGYATEALRAFLGAFWARQRGPDGTDCGPDGERRLSSRPEGIEGGRWHGEEEGRFGDVLEAHVHDGNVGSETVLRRCGFEFAWETVTSAHGRDDVRCMVYRIERPQ